MHMNFLPGRRFAFVRLCSITNLDGFDARYSGFTGDRSFQIRIPQQNSNLLDYCNIARNNKKTKWIRRSPSVSYLREGMHTHNLTHIMGDGFFLLETRQTEECQMMSLL
jgi:hypothetical protein